MKTATKPSQPIEKSTAGGSLLAQVIVAKWADHQPLHRQEKMFERPGIEISRKPWAAEWRSARNYSFLYQLIKKELLSSKVNGTCEGAGPQTSLCQDRADRHDGTIRRREG